jgi:hypothetical protein
MKLIYIHGLPATGKTTVAHALKELLPEAGVLENTASIDFAKRVLDMNDPGFWHLVFKIRETALEMAAVTSTKPYVIATACFCVPQDLPWLERYASLLKVFDGDVLPVHLVCHGDELERRIGNSDRVARGKLSTVEAFWEFVTGVDIIPVPLPNVMTIDTSETTPSMAATQIVERFGITL